MAVTGQRFLELSKAEGFEVTGHALVRLCERCGKWLAGGEARWAFCCARQVRPKQLIAMGYRPAYGKRLRKGQKSWYFRFLVNGREAIAVVQEGLIEGTYVWVTTFGRNRQSDHYRALSYEAVACMA